MRAFGRSMGDITSEALARHSPGDVFSGHGLAQQVTLRVIISAIFGVTEQRVARQFEEAVVDFNPAFKPPLMLMPFLRRRFVSFGMWPKFVRTRDRLDSLLQQQIDLLRGEPSRRGDDILSQMLELRYEDGSAMGDTQLKHELRTMLVAGHDTTAVALGWALHYVHAQPEVEQRLRNELEEPGEVPQPEQLVKSAYLGAVCDEALRIHPIVPLVLRRVTQPLEVAGVEIPAGYNVAVSLPLLHTDSDVWDEPEQFRPERFLERNYTHWQYAPFGAGTKRCLGAAFAGYQMRVALGTLLSQARFSLEKKTAPKPTIRGIVVGQSHRIPMCYVEPIVHESTRPSTDQDRSHAMQCPVAH